MESVFQKYDQIESVYSLMTTEGGLDWLAKQTHYKLSGDNVIDISEIGELLRKMEHNKIVTIYKLARRQRILRVVKKFEYLGPEEITQCKDCLYCQAGYDEETHCFHPKNVDHKNDILDEDDVTDEIEIPKWCPLPKVS